MVEHFDIAGYVRISVDDEKYQKNISIENQKAIIEEYVCDHFPGSTLTFFEDRDRSGYTFEQREGYQAMRRMLMEHKYDILIIKDFSRFSRRNGRGLVELEDLRDAGVRIISIGDNIDFPNDDDWLKIQFQFVINEMPVTDTSKKVRNVIKMRQSEGKWICAAPYGYIINRRKEFEIVPEEAEVVRMIYDLYINEGWGYKKIANYLTAQHIPTPRMTEQMRAETDGREYRRKVKSAWSLVSVSTILTNDFYIGTLRQGKYTRAKINGCDVRKAADEHIVIENNHPAIIDYRTFAEAATALKSRTRSNYRGVRKNNNAYSGFIVCGDCHSPMFAMHRQTMKPAYICGSYFNHGVITCTAHRTHIARLDELLKSYIRRVMDSSADMLDKLSRDIANEKENVSEAEQSAERLINMRDSLKEELKVIERQRIRELMKRPEREDATNAMYDELRDETQKKMDALDGQIDMLLDRRNTIIRTNRAAKTVMEIFNEILEKDGLDRKDVELIVDKIIVYTDHIEVKLKADIDALLKCEGGDLTTDLLIQKAKNQHDVVKSVNVISDGSPSLITLTGDELYCVAITMLAHRLGLMK